MSRRRQGGKTSDLDETYEALGLIRPGQAMKLLKCTPQLLDRLVDHRKLNELPIDYKGQRLWGYREDEVLDVADWLAAGNRP